MLSSLISEKTVKKGAPFSHTLSPLFHLFVLYPCPSIVQSGGADKAINSVPLHVQLPSFLSLLLSAFSFIHLLFSSPTVYSWQLHRHALAPPTLLLFLHTPVFSYSIYIHQLPLLFNPVMSGLTKLLNTATSGSSLLFSFSLRAVAHFSSIYPLDRRVFSSLFVFFLHLCNIGSIKNQKCQIEI